jgi:NTE family protein
MKPRALLVVAAMLLCSCAVHEVNAPIDHYNPEAGYRFDNLQAPGQPDKLFVVLTFSGGGTRAAALSYGVLEKLKKIRFSWNGEERTLLSEVDIISSVSGGSFTAAYYALFGDDIFQEFEERFLYRNVEGELKRRLFFPATWLQLASPRYSRIDMAADFYNHEIFREKKFADLVTAGRRPFVMLNATDMSMGSIFTFTQEKFDPICSDVGGTTIGRAVAASSCFPVAFAPLTISNYAGRCGYAPPMWVEMARNDLQLNPSRFRRAQEVLSCVEADERPYIHLLDGGVADNIGLRSLLAGIQSNDPAWSILNRIDNEEIDKLVFVVVDAKSKPEVKFDKKPDPPGLVDVLTKISTIPMDNYSFDTVQALRDAFVQWEKETLYYQGCRKVLTLNDCRDRKMPYDPPHHVDLYLVYVGFDQILDPADRSEFQKMATSFHLPKNQVDALRRIGPTLMEQSDDFKQLVRDLGAVEN